MSLQVTTGRIPFSTIAVFRSVFQQRKNDSQDVSILTKVSTHIGNIHKPDKVRGDMLTGLSKSSNCVELEPSQN